MEIKSGSGLGTRLTHSSKLRPCTGNWTKSRGGHSFARLQYIKLLHVLKECPLTFGKLLRCFTHGALISESTVYVPPQLGPSILFCTTHRSSKKKSSHWEIVWCVLVTHGTSQSWEQAVPFNKLISLPLQQLAAQAGEQVHCIVVLVYVRTVFGY